MIPQLQLHLLLLSIIALTSNATISRKHPLLSSDGITADNTALSHLMVHLTSKYAGVITDTPLTAAQVASKIKKVFTRSTSKRGNPGMPNPIELIDSVPIQIGNQQIPFNFELFNDMTAIASATLSQCVNTAQGVGYDASLNQQNGKGLRALPSQGVGISLLNPTFVRIATTIFGEIQNDFIYSGSNRISTIFGLVTSSADQIACRGMLGLSPNTMGTSTINGKTYVQPAPAYLTASGGSYFTMFLALDLSNVQNTPVTHVVFNRLDTARYYGSITNLPTASTYTRNKWSLTGSGLQIGRHTLQNQVQFYIIDNQNPLILLPNKVVDEIMCQIPGAKKFTNPQDGTSILYSFPCSNPDPVISFQFGGSSTQFTLAAAQISFGQLYNDASRCVSTIQYSHGNFGSLGVPFLSSFYSVYNYDSYNNPTSIGLATASRYFF